MRISPWTGAGEYLALVAPDLHVVQEYGSRANLAERPGFPPQRSDLSYGLYGSQEQYFIPPTPGKANSPGYPSISGEPIFSRESGTYTGYILLELRSPNPAAEVRYTLDGQIPTLASTKYTAPFQSPVRGRCWPVPMSRARPPAP